MRQRRSEPGRHDQLVQVALEVIIARGVAGATCRLIAEAANVPLGSMTYHSTSRDELVRRWMERSQAAIERQLPGLNGRALNAVREGLTLQRYFFPGEVDADLVHATLSAVAYGTASSDSESQE